MIAAAAIALLVLDLFGTTTAAAQEQILFPAVNDAQAVLLQKIRNERVRIDVGIWILGDGEIVQTLINKFTIDKVPVRVLGDRAIIFETDPDTRHSFELLANAGIPIRLRYHPTWYPEINHWKAMIFAGQGMVEFGSANYTVYELKPWSASDFKDESAMFTDDPAIVNAFRTKFDQYWVDTEYFKDWADAYVLETGITWTAAMTIPRGRQEPDYPTNIPGMIWGQGPELNAAIIAEIDREPLGGGVDMMFYRLTVPEIVDALIRKKAANIPVRVIAEPTQYRNDKWPEFWLVGAMVDRLIAAGIPVQQRLHQGLTHIKGMITSNVALNASANFARGWERDHNYFITASGKPLLYSKYRQRFDAMWNDGLKERVNYGPFQQLPPYPPTQVSPANGVVNIATQARLEWKRAPFATSFDVYLGTSQDTMTPTRVNAQVDENPPETYTFTPAQALQPNTIYYWRVVSRTYATDAKPSLAATSDIWSFRTAAGTGGGSGPFLGTPVSLPGNVEAENFDNGAAGVAYVDTTAGNSGGQYRTTDVDVTAAQDAGGGYLIGWVNGGEWVNYAVNVNAAGTYDMEFRVASDGTGGTFHVEIGGVNKSGSIAIPNTGGWQTWTTVRKTGIALSAGTQVIRLVMDAAGPSGAVGNFNWFRVVTPGTAPPGSTPFTGTPMALPGTVEAENFDNGGAGVAFVDTSSGNAGGQYRATDVDVTTAQDTGGGNLIGWVDAGEWVNYTVNVATAGTYDIEFRVASDGTGGTFHVEVAGVNKSGAIAIPSTGGWQIWTTVRKTGVALSAGTQIIRLVMDAVGPSGAVANFNWFRVVSAGGTAAPASTPFTGTPMALPGLIELENFDQGALGVAYWDTTAGNDGGAYRPTDVDLKASTDTGGGYYLGWTAPGEWLNYTVNIASAGVYTVQVRVASNGGGGTFHIEVDGVDKTGPLVIPNTSGWQAWTTISKAGVSLPAGAHVVRLVLDAVGPTGAIGNLNWIRIAP